MANKSSPVEPGLLKGWTAIAQYLGQTPAVAQRWHHEGMPVTKEGRSVYARPEELTEWVGTESGKRKPVHIASDAENLSADLKQALSYVRGQRKDSHS
jgi:hypothetical protein